MLQRTTRVNLLIGTGHFLSHFYILTLPPLFVAWHETFDVTFAELGLAVALMSGTTAILQTPAGFLVDRFGAKPYLIGGALLMSLSIAAMAAATSFWQILVLAVISGVGNAVFHPADYAILSGSIPRERLGRAFAAHLFAGHVGFALAPPIVAVMALAMGWRGAILIVGLLGLPVVAAIASQSRILVDKAPRDESPRAASVPRSTLLSLPMLLFFAFFTLGAMAQAGVQSWLITVLQTVNGVSLEIASAALTGFVGGTVLGVAIGGWLADHSHDRQLLYAGVMIAFSALLMLGVGILPMPSIAILVLISASGVAFGASRVSRDILVKNAAPPGEIGKVFGFVSAGLPFGQALTPVPFGFLIDRGHAEWILVLAAVILLLSLLCGGSASLGERNRLSAEA